MSDIPVRLRPRAIVPSGWPPDVAPNQIITAAHINAIRSSVYAWPGDVDGQGHTLSNVHLAGATGVLADPTTTAGDLIARDAAALGRVPIGSAGQVLTVDLTAPAKLKWATPAVAPVLSVFGRTGAVVAQAGDYTAAQVTGAVVDSLTTKGDIFARGAATGRFPAGSDGQVLRADASQAFGLRWSGESVPSVFGRTGAVVAQAGDYDAAKVTNAVSVLGAYPDPAWLTSLSWGKLIGTPATFAPAAHTHDAGAVVSGVLATARLGSGVADATVYLRGDGTWAAAGTGGGGGVVSVFGRAGNVVAQAGDYTAAMVTGAITDPTTSTGDLIVRNNINALTRLPIGANGQVLQTDLATSVGMKWTSISASVQTPWVTNIDAAAFNLTNIGRLGVAVTVPNYPIDVIGDINYTGVLRSNGVPVVFGGSQTPWTQNINASGFALNNVGTLGIGVAAPQSAPLQVATHTPGVAGSVAVQDLDANVSGNPTLLVSGLGSEGSRCWAVGNRGGATFGKSFYVWNDRSSDMLFGTNSAERMRITAAGNVGIGTASPDLKLTVAGGVHIAADSVGGGGASPLWVGGATDTRKNLYISFDTTANIGLIEAGISGVSWNNLCLNPNGGNVGIGTASPSTRLHVLLSDATAGVFGAPTLMLQNTSGVGSGTAIQSMNAGGGVTSEIRFINGPGAGLYPNNGGSIAFSTYDGAGGAGTERMRITAAGNVGIATTNPGVLISSGSSIAPIKIAVFDSGPGVPNCYGIGIASGIMTFGANINAVSGVPQMVLSAVGRLGVGLTNPAYTIDCVGDVNCTGAYRVNGTPLATGGGPTTQSSVTGSRAAGVVYHNTTGKPMYVTVSVNLTASLPNAGAVSDASTAPSVTVASCGTLGSGDLASMHFVVLPGNYYQVVPSGLALGAWVEWT